MKSAPSIAFDFSPCRGLAVALVVVILLAVMAIFLSGIHPIAKLCLALLVTAYGSLILYRHLKPKFVRVARGEGGWLLVDDNGSEFPVELIDHLRRGFLLVLSFRRGGTATHRLVLTPGNSDRELRRRLVLILATGSDRPAGTTIS